MKAYVDLFLNSALIVALRPCRFIPEERASGTHWIGRWVGPRTSLDDAQNRKSVP
jgi:hypothetical protein